MSNINAQVQQNYKKMPTVEPISPTKKKPSPIMTKAALNNSSGAAINDPEDCFEFSYERPPIMSPTQNHKDYQRYKYYSCLRTGYVHLGQEKVSSDLLMPPLHTIDVELLKYANPFAPLSKYYK